MSSLRVEIGWGCMENILCPGTDKAGIQAYVGRWGCLHQATDQTQWGQVL